MNELEKAQKVISDPNFKIKVFSKENDINYSTLYKYMASPDKMKKGVWSIIHNLAIFYDKKHEEKLLNEINPMDIHDFENWIRKELPDDLYGKKIKQIILSNRELYLKMVTRR